MRDLLNNYCQLAITRSDYFEPKTKTRNENVVKEPQPVDISVSEPRYSDAYKQNENI